MKDNILCELIQGKEYNTAMKIIEEKINELLIKKLDYKDNFIGKNSIELLDYCIKNNHEYYEVLTYLRNLYFFSENSCDEKLYDLIHIYNVIKDL